MKKIKIDCICRPDAGAFVRGSMEIVKGQNVMQSAKDWYEKQIADFRHPARFEDCCILIDGGVVSRKSATFVDDVCVNIDSKLVIIPYPDKERKGSCGKVVFTVEQLRRLIQIIEEDGANDSVDYIYGVADEQGVSL